MTDPAAVARLLGWNLDFVGNSRFDLLIVGGGPAGVTAGVYAGAEGSAENSQVWEHVRAATGGD